MLETGDGHGDEGGDFRGDGYLSRLKAGHELGGIAIPPYAPETVSATSI